MRNAFIGIAVVAMSAAVATSHAPMAQAQSTAAEPAPLPELTVETTAKKKAAAKKASTKSKSKAVAKAPPPSQPDAEPASMPEPSSGRPIGSAAGTEPVNGYVAGDTTTGSKSGLATTSIPQSISTVGRQELDDRRALKVDEALRYTAGVAAQPFGPDPDTDWVFIRGFQATQSGIFLDSLPLYAYGFGGFQIDPFLLERVEVLKGPSSALYGGGNPGGIVNLISKRPIDQAFGYVEGGINNFGNGYLGVDFGDRIDPAGHWSYRITGRIAGGDQYTDVSEDFRGSIAPQITYRDSDTRLTLHGHYSALDQIHIGGGFLPYVGTVVDAPFGKIPRKAFLGEPDIDFQKRQQLMAGYEIEQKLLPGLTFVQNARYGNAKGSQAGPYGFGYYDPSVLPLGYPGNARNPSTPDNLLFRLGFEEESEVNTFLIDSRLEARLNTGRLSHTVLIGQDYKFFNIDHKQASSPATPISVTNPVYGAPQPSNFRYLDQDVTQQQVGFYVQDQIRFGGGWITTLNGRYDKVYTDSDSVVGPTYELDENAVSGRAGLGYEFSNGLTPYVSAATFFNPVIGGNLNGADPDNGFEAETGYQYEAGIKYRPKFMDVLITASVFDITRENVLSPLPGSPTFAQIQLGEVTSKGFEIEGKANLSSNLRVLASYTHFDLETTKDTRPTYVGKTPFIVPETVASAWLDYKFDQNLLRGVSIGAGVRYVGESWVDMENTAKVPDVTLVDAAVRYERDTWGIALNVTNLFDEAYVKSCQDFSGCGYGDARTFMISPHYKW